MHQQERRFATLPVAENSTYESQSMGRLAILLCLLLLLIHPSGPAVAQTDLHDDARLQLFNQEDLDHWAFQPVGTPEPPRDDEDWPRNEVDHFVLSKLHDHGLAPAPECDKAKLLRRVYYDLTGMPPTAEETEDFIADDRIDAYDRVVERLLASHHYGERWAQHWLDLVRYAESDGYRKDSYRSKAWRFREYVVNSFNDDKPFDRFVLEQLAGDELFPDDPDAVCATGFLRLGVYEYNQSDVRGQWSAMLNEMASVTGEVFLGLSIGCAECHDHKFDPITQEDFYRLRAFFEATSLRDDVPLATFEQRAEYNRQSLRWLAKTKAIQEEMQAIHYKANTGARKKAISRFPKDIRTLVKSDLKTLSPAEQLIAELAHRQVLSESNSSGRIKNEARERWEELKKQIDSHEKLKPSPLPAANTVTDLGSIAPDTFIPGEDAPVAPGFPSVLHPEPAVVIKPAGQNDTTGRRSALAMWIASEDNPLSTRVIVNRIWQHHFGQGLVQTSSDFGNLGEPPSHPKLLDWLTSDFVANGWSMKSLHRRIVTSATYRQSSVHPDFAISNELDPQNRLLWRANGRRLSAEEIRDTVLTATSTLDLTQHGPSVSFYEPRRSIYVKIIRNSRTPFMSLFDSPNCVISTAERSATTTSLQSLFLLNGEWLLEKAKEIAARVADYPEDEQLVGLFQSIYMRNPTPAELAIATSYVQMIESRQQLASTLVAQSDANCATPVPGSAIAMDRTQALIDLAHMMLVSNQFLFVE